MTGEKELLLTIEGARGSDGRETAFGRDWTKGSVVRNLLLLSWPIIVSNSLNLLGPTIDLIWVGKLGAAAIAGVGVAGVGVMMSGAAMLGLTAGVRALIARFIGTGDIPGASHVARQAFVITVVFGIIVAVTGIFFAGPLLDLMGLEPDVIVEGEVYLRIMFVGSVATFIRMLAEGIMQASGDSVTPMRVAVFFRLFHVALGPFLVFGWWLFPRLGVSGAAISNVISQGLGMVFLLWVFYSGRSRLQLTLRDFRLDLGTMWRIMRISIPASISGAGRSFGGLVLMWIIVPFGTLAVAAHSLYLRLEIMLVVVCMGFGVGAGVLAGQNLGARQPERAERSGWSAAGLAQGLMLVFSVAILIWAENIVRVFSTEPALVKLASDFIRISVAGYLVLGFSVVLQNAILGAGDTLAPMLITLLSIWVVQVPLAFLLPQITGLGVYGVRWAIVVGLIASAASFAVYFRLGKWKHKRL